MKRQLPQERQKDWRQLPLVRTDAESGRISVNCYRDELATPADAAKQVTRILHAYPNQVTPGFSAELERQFIEMQFTKQQCADAVSKAIRLNRWANISEIIGGNSRDLQLFTGKEFVAMQDGGKHSADEFYHLVVNGTHYFVMKKYADRWGVDIQRLEKYLNQRNSS
jgi:hypothetical protein